MDSKKKTNKTRCRACPASGFCSDVCYNRDVPDVTCAHAVKYDKLNKRVASLEGQMETVKFMPLKQRDVELEKLWDEFADVPMNPDTEKMEGAFLHFPAGTPREDIWHWFDERYSKGVAALLYGRGEDNTATIATLAYRNELCCECDSELCAFADASGICRAPFITGAAPRIHEDGCDDFCSKCDAGCTASVEGIVRILRLDGIWSSRTTPTSETLRFTAAPSTKMKISIPRKTRITGTIPAVLFCSLTGISRLSMSCGKR